MKRPNWEAIGAIAGILALIIAFLAWQRPVAAPVLTTLPATATPAYIEQQADASVTQMPVAAGDEKPIAGSTALPKIDSPTAPLLATKVSPPSTDTPMPLAVPIVPAIDTPAAIGDMVFVAAGEFTMGSPEGQGWDNEHPQHSGYLNAYLIDRTEVTNAMFARFADETGHETDAEKAGSGSVFDFVTQEWLETQGADWRHPRGPESSLDGLADHPVVQVSWSDAVAYCEWAGKRLPSEAEWEKAARGTDGRTYPWGDEQPAGELLNFADRNQAVDWADKNIDDNYKFAAPVGSYPAGASPFGALDMAGNVWEWLADWYSDGYYGESPRENPQGPANGDSHVIRGGSWNHDAFWARVTIRYRNHPFARYGDLGFRCARSS